MKRTLTPIIILLLAVVAVGLTACGSDPEPLMLSKDADGTSVQIEGRSGTRDIPRRKPHDGLRLGSEGIRRTRAGVAG